MSTVPSIGLSSSCIGAPTGTHSGRRPPFLPPPPPLAWSGVTSVSLTGSAVAAAEGSGGELFSGLPGSSRCCLLS